MQITTIGLDLAKSVFQVHGADAQGRVVVRKKLRREQVVAYFAALPPCLVGMEVCGGAHYWARRLREFGHEVRLMPAQYVKPYVKTNKNDARDAEGICEAVGRPGMRFVPVKSVEQQEVLSMHRVRQGFVKARTAQANQIRGLLAEFGLVAPAGIGNIVSKVPAMVDAATGFGAKTRELMVQLVEHFKVLDAQVQELERQIKAWHQGSEYSRRLEKIPGIGPLGASALVASIADANAFKSGRQLAAWLGLVPRQNSSGGKTKLQGISKRGDSYLRALLIHGARSAIVAAQRWHKPSPWLAGLLARRHPNVAAVALANKIVRTVWALLAHEREFQADYVSRPPVAA
jgi:transposase